MNWTQTGNVLTRRSQLPLEGAGSSAGIYAPTICCNDGRFYMVTTNVTTNTNFYVYTDDIRGGWSEPVTVDQDGIDPSLYFEDGRAYFMSNGTDYSGCEAVLRLRIGDAEVIRNTAPLTGDTAVLTVGADNYTYTFTVREGDAVHSFGTAQTKYLSSEVAGGFTGVIAGLYSQGESAEAEFTGFHQE